MGKHFRSEAGHHRECLDYNECNCVQLYKRDAHLKEDDELEEAYREMFDPDWGNE